MDKVGSVWSLRSTVVSAAAMLAVREIKGHGEMDWDANLTPQQFDVLKYVTVVVAACSLIMTSTAFYWFVRMRRGFKHE